MHHKDGSNGGRANKPLVNIAVLNYLTVVGGIFYFLAYVKK
jgi:hypothetical protein